MQVRGRVEGRESGGVWRWRGDAVARFAYLCPVFWEVACGLGRGLRHHAVTARCPNPRPGAEPQTKGLPCATDI